MSINEDIILEENLNENELSEFRIKKLQKN